MEVKDLRNKQIDELHIELMSLLRAQFGIRMQIATQQLSNNKYLKLTKKDIARVKTILTEKRSNHGK